MLGPIYWAISWILLRWHAVWQAIGLSGEFLKTRWDWVLAIVFLVLTVRGLLFPVFVKQIKSQRAMQALAPQLKELQTKHKGDRETLQKETMELYRREGTNPFMGCLPMVIQIPVMWSLFHVLRHIRPTMPERLKSLYGWTAGLYDSAVHAKLFGAPITAAFRSSAADVASQGSSTLNVRIVAGVLVAIMIISTYLTSRQMILKTGWAEDPQQKMIQRLMLYGIPVTLLISGFSFPIGVVIYWTTTNIFSLGQQFWVLRKYPPPPNAGKSGTAAKSGTATRTGGTRTGTGPVRTGTGNGRTPVAGKNPVVARRTTRGTTGTGPVDGKTPGRTFPGRTRAAAQKAAAQKNGVAPPVVDGRALAPKPGAKPVNPKKGNPAGKQLPG